MWWKTPPHPKLGFLAKKTLVLRLLFSWLCRNALETPGYIENWLGWAFLTFSHPVAIKWLAENRVTTLLSLIVPHEGIITTAFSLWSPGRVRVAETVLVSRQSIQKMHWLVVSTHDSIGRTVEEDGRRGKYIRSRTVFSGMLCSVTPLLPNLHRQIHNSLF